MIAIWSGTASVEGLVYYPVLGITKEYHDPR